MKQHCWRLAVGVKLWHKQTLPNHRASRCWFREKPRLNDKEKIVAYHEVGHAIVGYSMGVVGREEDFNCATRDGSVRLHLQLPTEDRFLMDEAELRGQIATLLGGRLCLAASQLVPPMTASH